MGLAYDVVIKLVEQLHGQGYRLYFDNFFTSPGLLARLLELDILATGTTLPNRRGFPRILKDKWRKKAKRGNCRWKRMNKVLCLEWMDKKVFNKI